MRKKRWNGTKKQWNRSTRKAKTDWICVAPKRYREKNTRCFFFEKGDVKS